MGYAEFLATKRARGTDNGIPIDLAQVHPMLHDWQQQIVRWAGRAGRAAVFADCGLGKTFIQVEWARLVADRTLILAPLSVARQTVRESVKLGVPVRYVRSQAEVVGGGVWVSNYEMAERFDPSEFGAVVCDESSILKNVDGATRRRLTDQWAATPFRLACTATPAPNDMAELTNHAEWLGVMSRAEMLAAYFVHDDDGWRLKGHAADPMFRWMASWAVALRTPSDLGYSDDGYLLPPLTVIPERVASPVEPPEGMLFATELGGVGGRAQVRRHTLTDRVARTVELVKGDDRQWIVWCGLNDEAEQVAGQVSGAVNVVGAWEADAKATALEAFQDGGIRVLVTKPTIAGFGMNFQNCSRMVFVGMSDSYEQYYQAVRRCWRFGQTEPVNVHVVVSDLEGLIVENVERKQQDAERMTDRLVRHMADELRQEGTWTST